MLSCCASGGSPETEAVSSEQQQDPAERRWWHGYFVRAGRLGGLRKVKKDTARVSLPSCKRKRHGPKTLPAF